MQFQWLATYDDGTTLEQYNPDGSENRWGDIDKKRVRRFDVLERDTGTLVFSQPVESGQRLIYRRHNFMKAGHFHRVLWMVGVQWNFEGRNIQRISYIDDAGRIAQAGRFHPDLVPLLHPWEGEEWEGIPDSPR